jgi:hypothetical protein
VANWPMEQLLRFPRFSHMHAIAFVALGLFLIVGIVLSIDR